MSRPKFEDLEIGDWKMVDEDLIREMRAGIDCRPKKIGWGVRTIQPMELQYLADRPERLDMIRQDIAHQAALNLFEVVKGGERYCVQVEWVEHNLDLYLSNFQHVPADQLFYEFPPVSVGYEGYIHKVEVKHYKIEEMQPLEFRTLVDAPTWRQIRAGVMRRLRQNVRLNNLIEWGLKHVVARLLYWPEKNPRHWGE